MKQSVKSWQKYQGRWEDQSGTRNRQKSRQSLAEHAGLFLMDGMGTLENQINSRSWRQMMYRLIGRFEYNAKATWRNPHEAAEVQVRWDQRRLERSTAPAPAPSRKPGRL